jgi:curli production assembly/transport component CsgE
MKLIIIFCLILSVQAKAQTDQFEEVAGLELNGLVIDETITKIGRDFYELFYSRWEAPSTTVNYSLYVREQPQPGRGTQISVVLNDAELISQAIQPREEVMLAVADYAVQLAKQQILREEQMAQQLENEDQQGSGIF